MIIGAMLTAAGRPCERRFRGVSGFAHCNALSSLGGREDSIQSKRRSIGDIKKSLEAGDRVRYDRQYTNNEIDDYEYYFSCLMFSTYLREKEMF